MDVLDLVAQFGRPVRFSLLLEKSHYPKATLYRLLQTLTRQNLLEYDSEYHTYALGVRLVRLAHAAWSQSSLAPIARPYLDCLSAEVGHTVHLAQLDNAHVLYVDKRNADHPVEMFSEAGKVGPVYCTGVGKAMLAFQPPSERQRIIKQQSFHRFTDQTYTTKAALEQELEHILERGFAYDKEEHETGIICVAHPILSSGGRVMGSVSITGSTRFTDLSELTDWAPKLSETANLIAKEAETWRFPSPESKPIGR